MNPTKKNDRQDGGAGRQDQDGMGRQQDQKQEERTPTRQGGVGNREDQERQGQRGQQKQDQDRRPGQDIEKDLEE